MTQKNPTRRAVLCGSAALPLVARGFPLRDRRPNVLFIIADQHRHDAAGFGGAGFATTPNLDALARNGTTLRDAYCQVPLCLPSRQSLLTGQYASTHGYFRDRPADIVEGRTFAHDFQAAGYATTWIGKTHCDSSGFQNTISQEDLLAAFQEKHPQAKLPAGKPEPRRARSIDLKTMNMDYADLRDGPVFHMEEHVSTQAIEVLRKSPAEQPFFMVASYLNPHPPLFPPAEFLELYRDAELPFEQDYGVLNAEPFRDLRLRHRVSGWKSLSEEQAHNIVRAYYASIAWMDDCVGRLVDQLDSGPGGRDTLVIYTSDHGEQLGEHGLWQKRALYDASCRVPLILRWPGKIPAGKRLPRVVEHLDLVASLYELCGVENRLDSPGRSFAPMLRGEDQAWTDRARVELSLRLKQPGADELQSKGGLPSAGHWALRLGDWKYIEHEPEQRALYHLVEDPGELSNRILDPLQAERIETMRSILIAGNPERWAFHTRRKKQGKGR